MARDFTDILNAVWAANALTTIPNPPIPGQAYRNTEIDDSNLENGQQYSEVYDSARYNQLLYLLSGCLKMLMETGIPEWSAEQNYQPNAYTIGSDGKLYGPAKKASGPDNGGAVDPVTDAAGESTTWTLSLPDFEAPLAFDAAEGKVKLSVGNTTTVTDGKLEVKVNPNGGLQSSVAGVGIKPVASGPVTVDANGVNVSTFTAPTASAPGKAGLVPAPQAINPTQQPLRVLGPNVAFNTLTAGNFDVSWERANSTNIVQGMVHMGQSATIASINVTGSYYCDNWTDAPFPGAGIYELRELCPYGIDSSGVRVNFAWFFSFAGKRMYIRGATAARAAGTEFMWNEWGELLGTGGVNTLAGGVAATGVAVQDTDISKTWALPVGGTWRVFWIDTNTSDFHGHIGDFPGGYVITAGTRAGGIAIKIQL